MFSTQSGNFISICPSFFYIISVFAVEFEEPKIGISGKELTVPNDKIVYITKLEALADYKENM